MRIEVTSVSLPDFGTEGVIPELPITEYRVRLERLIERAAEEGFDVLAVYGDREHAANLCYLTGFDPRFEEALLLIDAGGGLRLLVGNECLGYLPDPAVGCQVELFQEFSLMGQQRDESRPLRRILSDFGIGTGMRAGCIGWKAFGPGLLDDPARAIEIPAFIVDALRSLTGATGLVRNATGLLTDPRSGLRITSGVDQLARFEFASIQTSESIKALIEAIREGVSEVELERCYQGAGLPLSCHPMVSFGEKARRGLSSPSSLRARRGDPFTAAFGVQGAMTCRAGMVASAPGDLDAELETFYPEFVRNYFATVVSWYQHVAVGRLAGDVVAAVEAVRDDRLLRLAVNPGHSIHLDEWVSSPFERGSDVPLRSGMALQMDIIPVSQGPFCCNNAEDGVLLADDSLRERAAKNVSVRMATDLGPRGFHARGSSVSHCMRACSQSRISRPGSHRMR